MLVHIILKWYSGSNVCAWYFLLGHPWLANYHDVKIPLDMIIYKVVKAYICSSSLRKAALGV